jgi:hypothetical protein
MTAQVLVFQGMIAGETKTFVYEPAGAAPCCAVGTVPCHEGLAHRSPREASQAMTTARTTTTIVKPAHSGTEKPRTIWTRCPRSGFQGPRLRTVIFVPGFFAIIFLSYPRGDSNPHHPVTLAHLRREAGYSGKTAFAC